MWILLFLIYRNSDVQSQLNILLRILQRIDDSYFITKVFTEIPSNSNQILLELASRLWNLLTLEKFFSGPTTEIGWCVRRIVFFLSFFCIHSKYGEMQKRTSLPKFKVIIRCFFIDCNCNWKFLQDQYFQQFINLVKEFEAIWRFLTFIVKIALVLVKIQQRVIPVMRTKQ